MENEEKTRAALIEELRQSEERFRAIAETAKDSIFTKDLERRYTYVNRAMAELFGCRRENLIGKTPEEIFDPESVEKIAEVDRVALEGGTADQVHALLIGDQEHVFHTIQVPVRNDDDDITGICGIVRDITDQKRAENRLQSLHDLFPKLAVTVGLNDTLRSCVNAALQNTALDSAGIYLVDEFSGELNMV